MRPCPLRYPKHASAPMVPPRALSGSSWVWWKASAVRGSNAMGGVCRTRAARLRRWRRAYARPLAWASVLAGTCIQGGRGNRGWRTSCQGTCAGASELATKPRHGAWAGAYDSVMLPIECGARLSLGSALAKSILACAGWTRGTSSVSVTRPSALSCLRHDCAALAAPSVRGRSYRCHYSTALRCPRRPGVRRGRSPGRGRQM